MLGPSSGKILKAAGDYARVNNLGVYGPECYQTENKNNPKCTIEGNINQDTKKHIYHFPCCGGYNTVIVEKFEGDQWFCFEKEAVSAGFEKTFSN